jgi:hypothetical protein
LSRAAVSWTAIGAGCCTKQRADAVEETTDESAEDREKALQHSFRVASGDADENHQQENRQQDLSNETFHAKTSRRRKASPRIQQRSNTGSELPRAMHGVKSLESKKGDFLEVFGQLLCMCKNKDAWNVRYTRIDLQ